MKKLVAILLSLIMALPFSSICSANFTPPNEILAEKMDLDSYYECIWKNFSQLLGTPNWYISTSTNHHYKTVVNKLSSDVFFLGLEYFPRKLSGEKLTTERYLEILINLMIVMEYDYNDLKNSMADIDTLKTFGDYAMDIGGIAVDMVDIFAPTELRNFATAMGLTFSATETAIENAEVYKNLSKVLQNYEQYHLFLGSIIQHGDGELKEAAQILQNGVSKATQYKLNAFNKATENTAEFLGKDVFLDTIVMEIIENPENLNLNATDQWALGKLADGYKGFKAFQVGSNIGMLAGDFFLGTSNMFNRLDEMKALLEIDRLLSKSQTSAMSQTGFEQGNHIIGLDGVSNYYQYFKYRVYVNYRGDYAVYELAKNDMEFLSILRDTCSLFAGNDSLERWFHYTEDTYRELFSILRNFYPNPNDYLKLSDNQSEPQSTKDTETNTRGNTVGNIVNAGHVAQQGDWIYYSNWSGLYKIRTDGTQKTKLNDEKSSYINVVGDWIYYCQDHIDGYILHKIRTDGTQKTKLNDDYSSYINVVGDWIYYSNWNDNRELYKVRTDGTQRTKLNDDGSYDINVVDDWIYYQNDSDDSRLYKIRTDGTQKTKLNDDISCNINVVGDWVYYSNRSDGWKLYKIRIDGTQRTKLNDDNSYYINVVGDWIYYQNDSDNWSLYKIRTDGVQKTKLNDVSSSYINVVGDWICYLDWHDDMKLYKIQTNETGDFPINT